MARAIMEIIKRMSITDECPYEIVNLDAESIVGIRALLYSQQPRYTSSRHGHMERYFYNMRCSFLSRAMFRFL